MLTRPGLEWGACSLALDYNRGLAHQPLAAPAQSLLKVLLDSRGSAANKEDPLGLLGANNFVCYSKVLLQFNVEG